MEEEEGALSDECNAQADDESDDPVEDCSDIEAPSYPLEPSTPKGAAGRFATLLGVERSAGRGHGESPPAGHPSDDAIGATQLPQDETGQDVAVSASAGLLLTQALEDIMEGASGHGGGAGCEGSLGDNLPAALLSHRSGEAHQLEETVLPHGMEHPTGLHGEVEVRSDRAEARVEVEAEAEQIEAEVAERPPAPRPEGEGLEAEGAVDSEDSEGELPEGAPLLGRSEAARLQPQGQQQPLPEEPWMSRPERERELWERVRPRGLRQEAARLQSLRLPAAALGRIMRLNPGLQMRSMEALEVMNFSTLLLIQAVARASARGKLPGQHVNFEDIRAVCSSVAELQFLHPLSCTLDPSSRVMHRDSSNHGAAVGAAAAEGSGIQMTRPRPVAEEAGEQQPGEPPQLQPVEEERKGVKRRATSSGPKTSGKASRSGLNAGRTGPAARVNTPSIATFFSKATAAVD